LSVAQNKRKGYEFEIDCCEFVQPEYPLVERNGTRYGPKDRGDLANVGDWTLQCKNVKTDKWALWFKATLGQSVNNKTRWWAVIRKARNQNVRESLFCMPLWKGLELMTHLRDLEAENEKLKERIKELEND
jgi:hypothetical protein